MKHNYHYILEKYFFQKGQKYSSQRKLIVDEIFKFHKHLEPQILISQILKKYNNISRATIFRTIKLLWEAGFISKTSDKDGLITYEHTLGHNHHDHLICLICGKVIEISNKNLEKIKTKLCKSKQFNHKYHNLQIYGECKKCQKKKR